MGADGGNVLETLSRSLEKNKMIWALIIGLLLSALIFLLWTLMAIGKQADKKIDLMRETTP
jgi:hypothetical protein